ncbi:MAG: heavy metal translocating P-type ATPase, partial [Paracoccaceae bacterium]|nr:heavy metal translocating P-type ATPase [Paracoccaceae bacterium]
VVTWLVFGPDPALGFALVSGVSVLIVACPCAMGLATPVSIMVGTGRAAEIGVLFRKGDALQALQDAGIVAFDKTGTLTAGRPELTELKVLDGFEESEVLRVLASVEALSEHPIAQAIVRAANKRGLVLDSPEDFVTETGFGVRATVDGRPVLIGADRLMAREGIALDALKARAAEIAKQAQTPLFVAIDGKLAALIGVSDPIKPQTAGAIAALHEMGLQVAMITGDNADTAHAIAAKLGIDHVVAEVLPEGKVAALDDLRQAGKKVAYVGDGINDAPALAAADVGIAIGTGTDIAIESADVVLISGDINGVINAFEISRRTMRNIKVGVLLSNPEYN